jgi:arylsulfatase
MLFWEHEGNAAVRRGDWKLVRLGGKGKWELYDLKSDRTEQYDLAAEKPGLAAELKEAWLAWAQRAHVSPDGQPKKKGKK